MTVDKQGFAPEALTREYAEKVLEYREFLKGNRLYAFREANEQEKIWELSLGEKLFTPPNPKQKLLLDAWDDSEKKVFTFCGGNKSGKTTIGTIIILETLFGIRLWDDSVIKFPHHYPRKARYVGQGWESHIKAVVVPALKFWWPSERPIETKKNNQGVEAIWKDVMTGSSLEIMSTSQSSDVFEGWDGDLVVYDEPPPRDVRVACARGLVVRKGRELFAATLLKEAWIHREVIKARLENGKVDPTTFNVTGEIYDNLGYGITQEGIDQFAKTLKPEEKQARLFGIPSYMSSLVYENIKRDLHIKPEFKIPLDWIVDIQIDFHPSKPWAVLFNATAKNGFKYFCKEMEIKGNPKFVGEEIVRYIKENNLRIGRAQIDPLAKGDQNNDNTVYEILGQVLSAYGISLDVASKDKDNGIALLNNLLWTENEMPGQFFFDNCVKTFQQMEDLMYDPESLKPTALKVDDDFAECAYRHALMNTQWYEPINYDTSKYKSVIL